MYSPPRTTWSAGGKGPFLSTGQLHDWWKKARPDLAGGYVDPWNDPDMYAAAQAIAAGLIDPQIAAINRAIKAKQLFMEGQAKAGEGVIAAVGKIGAGIPSRIQEAYSRAGQETAGMAQGLTGAVGAAAQSAANEVAAQIAAQGAPGAVTSEGGAAMNTANYLGGYLPASNLAAEAANRLTESSTMLYAGELSLAQTTLNAMNATREEAEELRNRGLDVELTRPAEIQKALLMLRQERRAEEEAEQKAEDMTLKKSENERLWRATLEQVAESRTQMTGWVHYVDKNGKIRRSATRAPGSTAGVTATQAATSLANAGTAAAVDVRGQDISAANAAARAAEQQRHNQEMESLRRAGIGLSAGQLKVAQDREKRLNRSPKNGGPTAAQKAKWSETAGNAVYDAFYGYTDDNDNVIERLNTDPQKVMTDLLARGIPWSLIKKAMLPYANLQVWIDEDDHSKGKYRPWGHVGNWFNNLTKNQKTPEAPGVSR